MSVLVMMSKRVLKRKTILGEAVINSAVYLTQF